MATFTQTGGTLTGSADLLMTDSYSPYRAAPTAVPARPSSEPEGDGTISNGPLILTGNRGFTNRGTLTLVGTGNGFNLNGNTQSTVTNADGRHPDLQPLE